jgi:hypothetical protein
MFETALPVHMTAYFMLSHALRSCVPCLPASRIFEWQIQLRGFKVRWETIAPGIWVTDLGTR